MSSQKSNNTKRFIVGCVLPACILGLIGGLLYYFLRDTSSEELQTNVQNIIDKFPDLDIFQAEDPYSGLNGTYAWPNEGKGLSLTLINSLENQWYEFFVEAINDWDAGTPDALTLTMENGTIDNECDPINGVMNVCDGDYGETGWKGINKVLLDNNGRIYASSARMNEYFLPVTSDPNERLYTMCHEIGHGFGLPHTDEHFYNLNQGNCLDYTTRPKSNMHPDERNYNTLAQLYGTNDGSVEGTTSSTTSGNSNSGANNIYGGNTNQGNTNNGNTNNNGNANNNENENTDDKTNNNDDNANNNNENANNNENNNVESNNNANNRDRQLSLLLQQDNEKIPDWMMNASKQIDEYFSSSNTDRRRRKLMSTHNHRILKQNQHIELHEFHIEPHGHTVQVHLLLA